MMACNISKNFNDSSNFSGSLVNSALSYGYLTLGFSGSGLFVNMYTAENGNIAADYTPILKSDSIEQF